MSQLEAELLANLPKTPPSPAGERLTVFPQPRRLIHAKGVMPPWRNEAERNAWLDTFDPNGGVLSPKDYREVSLEDL